MTVRKWLVRAAVVAVLLVALALISGYGFIASLFSLEILPIVVTPPVYIGRSGEGTVVDATTGNPVGGAIVVAWWELQSVTAVRRHLVVKEAVTDESGKFKFEAWGPVRKRPLASFLRGDPEIIAFKKGYRMGYRGGSGGLFNPMRSGPGGTIAIQHFGGSSADYAASLASPSTHFLFGEEDCLWKEAPQFVVAIDELERQFEREGVRHSLGTLTDIEANAARNGCGSVREYLRSHQP